MKLPLIFFTVLFASAFQAQITTANPIAKERFDELPPMTQYTKYVDMVNNLLVGNPDKKIYDVADDSRIKVKLTVETEQIDELSLVTRYAGMGYNLLMANPEGDFNSGGADPGIKTTRFIFKHTYTKGSENDAFYKGKVLKVPDQVTFHTTQSCAMSQHSDAYSGQKSYRDELSLSVEASTSYQDPFSLFSASFALSTGMKEVSEITEDTRSVIVQNTSICQLGVASYNLNSALYGANGYDLTDEFKYAIRLLPSTYSKEEYTRFLDNWGTHIIIVVKVGTRDIKKSKASYKQVYKFLSEQNSAGVTIGGDYSGVSGSISLNIETLDKTVDTNTRIGESLTQFKIGSEDVPMPIKIQLVTVDKVMASSFWDDSEWSEINQKRTHLHRALLNYAANKEAHIADDPSMTVEVQWPDGTYSLPMPKVGCPDKGWSIGWRYQDNEDDNNANAWNPRNVNDYITFGLGNNYETYYCTKTYPGNNGFTWPKGNYCIARYGGSCPANFHYGEIYWDDEDDSNGNSLRSPYPDGEYGADTLTRFCCKSDGSAADEVILPPTKPFVLWRHNGMCQMVKGMNDPVQLDIYFDDEDDNNRDRCVLDHPDDSCDDNHQPSMCYYSPRN